RRRFTVAQYISIRYLTDMYEYQKSGRYFAQCADDIQEIVAEELEELGANAIKPGYRGVYFTADR
ncbi:MAG: hypothetical protein ACOCWH_01625, partial [Spirochaetota bacterium]